MHSLTHYRCNPSWLDNCDRRMLHGPLHLQWTILGNKNESVKKLMTKHTDQFGFDNTESMALKAQWINSLELEGRKLVYLW